MSAILAVLLIVLLVAQALAAGYAGQDRPRWRWFLLLNAGIVVLFIIFIVDIVTRSVLILGAG